MAFIRKSLLLTLFFSLLVLLLLQTVFVEAKGNKKKSLSPFEKRLKNRREELRKTKCSHLGEDLSIQCQNYYINPGCFRQAYGERGLELGEVYQSRDNEF